MTVGLSAVLHFRIDGLLFIKFRHLVKYLVQFGILAAEQGVDAFSKLVDGGTAGVFLLT